MFPQIPSSSPSPKTCRVEPPTADLVSVEGVTGSLCPGREVLSCEMSFSHAIVMSLSVVTLVYWSAIRRPWKSAYTASRQQCTLRTDTTFAGAVIGHAYRPIRYPSMTLDWSVAAARMAESFGADPLSAVSWAKFSEP